MLCHETTPYIYVYIFYQRENKIFSRLKMVNHAFRQGYTVGPHLTTTPEIGPPRNCDHILADGFFHHMPLC